MKSFSPDHVISTLEVTVKKIDGDFVVLASEQQDIFWPIHRFTKTPLIGDQFVLELTENNIHSIQKLVDTAKNDNSSQRSEEKNVEVMRKLLESLIN